MLVALQQISKTNRHCIILQLVITLYILTTKASIACCWFSICINPIRLLFLKQNQYILHIRGKWHSINAKMSRRLLHSDTFCLYACHFSTVLFIQTSDYYIISEETNCNCCNAAYLFTYCCLLLPIICLALFYGQFFISLVSRFQSHQCQTTTGSFQSPTFGGMQHYLQSNVKVLHFTR